MAYIILYRTGPNLYCTAYTLENSHKEAYPRPRLGDLGPGLRLRLRFRLVPDSDCGLIWRLSMLPMFRLKQNRACGWGLQGFLATLGLHLVHLADSRSGGGTPLLAKLQSAGIAELGFSGTTRLLLAGSRNKVAQGSLCRRQLKRRPAGRLSACSGTRRSRPLAGRHGNRQGKDLSSCDSVV